MYDMMTPWHWLSPSPFSVWSEYTLRKRLLTGGRGMSDHWRSPQEHWKCHCHGGFWSKRHGLASDPTEPNMLTQPSCMFRVPRAPRLVILVSIAIAVRPSTWLSTAAAGGVEGLRAWGGRECTFKLYKPGRESETRKPVLLGSRVSIG